MAVGLTLSMIREALAKQIKDNVSRECNVKAYRVGGNPGYPLITIAPQLDYLDYWLTSTDATGNRVSQARFTIIVQPGKPGEDGLADESARRRLDDFLSVGQGNGSSIADAVMRDVSLGGVVATCQLSDVEVDDDTATARIPIAITTRTVEAEA